MEMQKVEYPLLQPRTSNEVRVVSWNVYYGDGPTHADDVIAALKFFDCDVLLLYELSLEIDLPEKIHRLGYGGVFVEANYRRSYRLLPPMKGGLALFSRFEIENYRIVETMSDGIFCVRRYYIEARLRVSENFSLTVGMTHNSLPFESGYARTCRALHEEIAKHKERYLFAADLNALPSFGVVQELHKQLIHLGPPLRETSHPTKRWVRYLTPARRIDYAFATPDVANMLIGQGRFGESHPSDHSPLLVHLRTDK